jgi:hypothetical protein
MGRHTPSVMEMQRYWTHCTLLWLFGKNASGTLMRGQPWGTRIW